jgi:hypothetical protein
MKKASQKLSLQTQTIRPLVGGDLAAIGGGSGTSKRTYGCNLSPSAACITITK